MADFEDANSPTWRNQVEGHVNLVDAIEGTIEYDASDGRHYALARRSATLLVRPRGWHLPEKHLRGSSDEPVVRRACRLRAVRVPLRAPAARPRLGALPLPAQVGAPPRGPAVERGVRVRAGRARPAARQFPRHGAHRDAAGRVPDGGDPLRAARPLVRPERRPLGLHLLDDQVLPGRSGVRAAGPHRRHDDRAVHARLHRAARGHLPPAGRVRDGRHVRADPVPHGRGGQPARGRGGPGRQAPRGRRRLRRHLGRPPRRRRGCRRRVRRGAGRPPQPDRPASATTSSVTPAQLLAAGATPGAITEAGLRNNVNVGFHYISFWLCGRGAAGINNLMEDAATAEISRSQIWQWIRHGATLADGRTVTRELVTRRPRRGDGTHPRRGGRRGVAARAGPRRRARCSSGWRWATTCRRSSPWRRTTACRESGRQ